jgi:diaminopimelate epimerase
MKIKFTKMHGLGNDFIVLDWRRNAPKNPKKIITSLADRRFGIGFDQALILREPTRKGVTKSADFAMEIYNSDGGKVEMCGNGIRCLARYIWRKGFKRSKHLSIETTAGIIRPEWVDKELVRVDMGEPELEGAKIPVRAKGQIVDKVIKADGKSFKVTCVSMGNPHAVIFVDDVDGFDVKRYGSVIENDKFFPKKTNVEFVQVVNRGRIKMRVWERGSGETLACGTGASASVVAAHLKGLTKRSVNVVLLGGVLKIELGDDDRVYMTGPAVEVFNGEIDI